MRNKLINALAAAAVLFPFPLYSADSSCVQCHTDDKIIKGLFVPPVMGESEGEG